MSRRHMNYMVATSTVLLLKAKRRASSALADSLEEEAFVEKVGVLVARA